VTADDEDLPAGWLTQFRRGVVAGAGLVALAVLLTAIPTFLAWFAPGADSTSAGHALKAAVLIAVAGNHGGLVLDGTPISLVPLLVTVLLGWLVAVHSRRPDTRTGFAGLVVGYTAMTGAAAAWATLGRTHVPLLSSVVAAFVFVLVIGSGSRAAADRWRALGPRQRGVARAAAGICAVYVLAGTALAGSALVMHLQQAGDLQARLSAGVGGLPVALIGVAAAPNAVLASIGYLAGPGFDIGSNTSISVFAVHRGQLPIFPLLAGLPSGTPATAFGVSAAVLVALLAGWIAVRLLRAGGASASSAGGQLTDLLVSGLLAGGVLAALTTLGAGSLGSGSLRHIGATGWQVGLAVAGLVSVTSACWSALYRLRSSHGAASTAKPASTAKLASTAKPAPAARSGTVSGPTSSGAASPLPAADGTDETGVGVRRLRSTG
jgi:hypothetical protein